MLRYFRHHRRWYRRSVLPDVNNNHVKQTKIEKIKLVISMALPLAVGIFTLVTTLQNRHIARQERAQDKEQAEDDQRENVFVDYINDIARYRDRNSHLLTNNTAKLLYIRTKTLTALRKLDTERKKRILQFLLESSLFSSENSFVWYGADFNQIKLEGIDCFMVNTTFVGVQFQSVSFINCIFINVTFNDSNLNHAIFTRSSLIGTHFIACRMKHVNFQDTILSDTHFNGSTLSSTHFQQAVTDTNKFWSVNLTEATFSTTKQNHLFIRNSILPDGTFSQVDEMSIDQIGECASLNGWTIEPEEGIQVKNCAFVSTVIAARMSQYILINAIPERSMLINANQAELIFQIRQNNANSTILITIAFIDLESLVYDTHNIDCSMSIDHVCQHSLRISPFTKFTKLDIQFPTSGISIDQMSFLLRRITTKVV